MLSLLTFIGVAALCADMLSTRGAQLLAWLKGAEATAADAAKKL
jgi:hypothetical protein